VHTLGREEIDGI